MAFWSLRVVQIPVRVRSSMEWEQVSLLLLFVGCCFMGIWSLESYLYGNRGWYNWGVKFYILPTRSICWCLWSLVGWWILGDGWGTRIPNLRTGTTKSCRCNGFVRFSSTLWRSLMAFVLPPKNASRGLRGVTMSSVFTNSLRWLSDCIMCCHSHSHISFMR